MDEPARWDPEAYARQGRARLRPALDLIAHLDDATPRTIVDLGCGSGEATRELATRWPGARVIGLDSSEDMLAKARASRSPVEWRSGRIEDWHADAPVDLLFSNAALHWLPDHRQRLAGWMAGLAAGGRLAVQMPHSQVLPSHRLMHEVWAELSTGDREMAPPATPDVGDPAAYLELLEPHAAAVEVWETEYLHVLRGDDAVFEWVAATGLRPFLQALDPPMREEFAARYRALLREAYPRRADGSTLYPFRRLFFVATVGSR